MTSLQKMLHAKIVQCESRLLMIPRYIERPGKFIGSKKDFSLDDLPKIHLEIDEAKAALEGIRQWQATIKSATP